MVKSKVLTGSVVKVCFVSLSLVVSTSAIDCLERLVAEMTCYVSSAMLNPTHSLTYSMYPAVAEFQSHPENSCYTRNTRIFYSEAKASVPGTSNKVGE